jgi:O-acetyl-ADP-ribose deacetylase (regulator of RNase III)
MKLAADLSEKIMPTPKANWRDKVRISQGDITGRALDAIVNAANNDLILGAGVAGAIRSKGGPEIQKECDGIGSIPLGEAAVTTGGKLKAKFVIHAASMHLGRRTSEENLRASTRNALLRASERKVESIGFPAIGTGIAGFPLDRCAQVMLEEVRDHLNGTTSVRLVEFVLFDRPALDTFKRVFDAMV